MQDSLNRNMQLITLSGRPINDCTFSESAFIYTKTPCVSFWFLLFLLKKKKKKIFQFPGNITKWETKLFQ